MIPDGFKEEEGEDSRHRHSHEVPNYLIDLTLCVPVLDAFLRPFVHELQHLMRRHVVVSARDLPSEPLQVLPFLHLTHHRHVWLRHHHVGHALELEHAEDKAGFL